MTESAGQDTGLSESCWLISDIVTGPSGDKTTFRVMCGATYHKPSRVSSRNFAHTPSISSSVGSGGVAT